jgi:hypothetical protein
VLPGLSDPAQVQDTFAEGFASIENIGTACVRFTLYVTRDLGEGEIDRLVVARIIVPREELGTLIKQAEASSSGLPFVHTGEEPSDQVH